MERIYAYILFFVLFICAQSFSICAQYIFLPYKNLSMWDSYKMSVPFILADWGIMTYVIYLNELYQLVTPTQVTFILSFIQFIAVLVLNATYLHQPVHKSDIIAFLIMMGALYVTFDRTVSRWLIAAGWWKVDTDLKDNDGNKVDGGI